jgi:hypothetical protein
MFQARDRKEPAMPHRRDGNLNVDVPVRSQGNVAPDRVQAYLDGASDHGLKGDGFVLSAQHGPTLGDLGSFHTPDGGPHVDHAGMDALLANMLDHVRGEDARVAPAVEATALGTVGGDVGPRLPGEDGGLLLRHSDHFNSQALTIHPDWFMI